jgi:hypothetical protein
MNHVTTKENSEPGGGGEGGAIAKAELGSTAQHIDSELVQKPVDDQGAHYTERRQSTFI